LNLNQRKNIIRFYSSPNEKGSLWFFSCNNINSSNTINYNLNNQNNNSNISNSIDSFHQNIAGVWKTDFGKMLLKQKRSEVYGNYSHDKGKISGLIVGNTLKGKWSRAPTYKPPKDTGDFIFTFSSDSKTFHGKWR